LHSSRIVAAGVSKPMPCVALKRRDAADYTILFERSSRLAFFRLSRRLVLCFGKPALSSRYSSYSRLRRLRTRFRDELKSISFATSRAAI